VDGTEAYAQIVCLERLHLPGKWMGYTGIRTGIRNSIIDIRNKIFYRFVVVGGTLGNGNRDCRTAIECNGESRIRGQLANTLIDRWEL